MERLRRFSIKNHFFLVKPPYASYCVCNGRVEVEFRRRMTIFCLENEIYCFIFIFSATSLSPGDYHMALIAGQSTYEPSALPIATDREENANSHSALREDKGLIKQLDKNGIAKNLVPHILQVRGVFLRNGRVK